MKKSILLLTLLSFLHFTFATEEDTLSDVSFDMKAIQNLIKLDSIANNLEYEHGKIDLGNGVATLNVPEGYKFLNSEQSSIVLTDLWGNPPSEVIGLLFPEDMTPYADNFTYAVEITYSEDGYIEDEDAKDLDYDDLLSEMQDEVEEENKLRVEQGYETYQLVRWAAEPFYDKENKKLHWAKEVKFGEDSLNTLNYNIRVLGRKGYLNMNAIGTIDVLPKFNQDIDQILSSVDFNLGYKYSEFNPDVDNIAAYGIGGLIAGKLLAKAGFFAVILKFWKIIAIAVVGFFGMLKRKVFGSKEE